MALESIAPVSTANVATPAQLQPIINPQSSSNGVSTLQNDPDSVVITLSEASNLNTEQEGTSADEQEYNTALSPEILNDVLSSNITIRLSYDAPLSRSFLEFVNKTTDQILIRFPSKNFISLINKLLGLT